MTNVILRDYLQTLYFATAISVVVVYVVRWIKHRILVNEMEKHFIHCLAENHLPHIYTLLEAICVHLKIPMPEPPAIIFNSFEEATCKKQEGRKG